MPRTGRRDAERYETLKREVAAVGLIRRGSLVRRLVACGKPNCCCQADPPRLHGPYYQWTRKVYGKTVTVRVNKTSDNFGSYRNRDLETKRIRTGSSLDPGSAGGK